MEMVESNVEIDSSQSAFHDGYPGNCIVPKSEVVEEDICKDGGLLKRILEEGEGCESPQDLDRVCVTYEACLLDTGRPVKKSDFGIWFKVKDGHFCPAFSMAVKTMKKGEKAIFTVKPQYGFGVEGKRDYTYRRGYYFSVPSNATLQITLELLTFKMKVPFSKTVLKVGEGYELPNKGAVVKVKLTGKLQDDSTVFFTKGHGGDDDQAEPFEFKQMRSKWQRGLIKL
jgi:FK506-binding protein 4/5